MSTFWKIVLKFLAIWLVIVIVGFVVKALFWLGIIGGIAFLITLAVGALKGKNSAVRSR